MYRVELKAVVGVLCKISESWFLMYRVELKGSSLLLLSATIAEFLMYRVELKAVFREHLQGERRRRFLMYRVELKAKNYSRNLQANWLVPNVPCGVESLEIVFGNSLYHFSS